MTATSIGDLRKAAYLASLSFVDRFTSSTPTFDAFVLSEGAPIFWPTQFGQQESTTLHASSDDIA